MSKILRIIQGYQPKDCGTSDKYKPPQGGSAARATRETTCEKCGRVYCDHENKY